MRKLTFILIAGIVSTFSLAQKPKLTKGNEPIVTSPVTTTAQRTSTNRTTTPVAQNSPETKEYEFEVIASDKVRIKKYIGNYEEVVIPGKVTISGQTYKVTEIGDDTFSSYTKLKKITIPTSIIHFGRNVFPAVSYDVCYQGSVNDWCKIDFDYTVLHGDFYAQGLLQKHISISNTNIPAYAFAGCTSIRDLDLKNTTTIGFAAFSRCSNLQEIKLPESLEEIEATAFDKCQIRSLFIPKNVTEIGIEAFTSNVSLISIKVDAKNTIFDSRNDCNALMLTNEDKLILGCKNSIIPNDTREIGAYAFEKVDIKEAYLPNVEKIEMFAFRESNIQRVEFGNKLIAIELSAFENSSLKDVNFPSSLKSIGAGAFKNCTNLTGKSFSFNGVTILPGAFMNVRLDSVTIMGGSVGGQYPYAFYAVYVRVGGNADIGQASFCDPKCILVESNCRLSNGAILTEKKIDYLLWKQTKFEGALSDIFHVYTNSGYYKSNPPIQTLVVGESVEELGVDFGKGLTINRIEWNAKKCHNWGTGSKGPFLETRDIKYIKIGQSVEELSQNTFCYDYRHTVDTLVWAAEKCISIFIYGYGYSISGNGNGIIKVRFKNFILDSAVKIIPSGLIESNGQINIRIPKSVERIEKFAFDCRYCRYYGTIQIEHQIDFIEEDAFSTLQRGMLCVDVPLSLEKYYKKALRKCKKVKVITH